MCNAFTSWYCMTCTKSPLQLVPCCPEVTLSRRPGSKGQKVTHVCLGRYANAHARLSCESTHEQHTNRLESVACVCGMRTPALRRCFRAACRHIANPSYYPKGKNGSGSGSGRRKRARRPSPGDEGEGEDGMDPDEPELHEDDDSADMECEECSD